MISKRAARVFGIADLLTGGVLAFGVFVALPSRWAPVDLTAGALTALELASGVGLLSGAPWAERVAKGAAVVALVLGLGTVTMLALTAGWLSGVYGAVGFGGAVILALIAALALPYLVVVPVVKLFWLRPSHSGEPPAAGSGTLA